MLVRFRLPKTLLWVFNLLIIFLMMFTAYRLITLMAFRPEGEDWSGLVPSFFLGLRFDLRWGFFRAFLVTFVLKPYGLKHLE